MRTFLGSLSRKSEQFLSPRPRPDAAPVRELASLPLDRKPLLSPHRRIMTKPSLDILLCAPRGFCAGVVRAIDAVEKALAIHGAPVYVRHEIVHNKYVVENLRRKGAVFVRELDEVPDTSAPVIFSAHGVPKSVPEAAERRNLLAIDAT